MANHKSRGYDWVLGIVDNQSLPHNKKNSDIYTLAPGYFYNTLDMAANDWLVTSPIPGDIRGDIIITSRRLLGSEDLTLDMEYNTNLTPKFSATGSESWRSVTGDKVTWNVSGTTTAAPAGDWFKWDIAENGIYPLMRLAYKNETGATTNAGDFYYELTTSFMRS